MATEAADDWIIPVNTAPTNTPSRGFSKAVSSPANWGISARGLTAPLISSMPYIKMAKPIMMRPTSRRRWRLEPMISRIPARAIRGEKFSGFSRFTKTFSLSMPVRDRIHAVRVVPMLEPMMMPMVCLNSMTPEFTRPTSITVMAEEDWMAMVMPAPSSKLLKGLEVMRLSIRSVQEERQAAAEGKDGENVHNCAFLSQYSRPSGTAGPILSCILRSNIIYAKRHAGKRISKIL